MSEGRKDKRDLATSGDTAGVDINETKTSRVEENIDGASYSKGSGSQDRSIRSSHSEEEKSREKDLQKRKSRATKKELLELIQRKNEMLQEMERKIEELTESLKNQEDKFIRLAAEYDNYRKRSRREWELQKKRAGAELISELLIVIDDFYRAFENISGKDDNFTSGIRMIFSRILDVLQKSGVTEIDSLGKKFDPRYHEAIGHVETDEYAEGEVAQVVQRGYMYHDEVLRPARVLVARKKEKATEPDKQKTKE